MASLVIFSAFYFFPRTASASDISIESVIKLVNESREAIGLPVLVENSILNEVAKDKIRDMLNNNYFAHTSPEGKDPWFWFAKNNYEYSAAGENLALNFKSAENQHKAWMASPTHKKNIINPSYKEIGVAVAEGRIDGKEATVTVQVFGMPAVIVVGKEENHPTVIRKEQVLPAEIVKTSNLVQKSTVLGGADWIEEAYFRANYGFLSTEKLMLFFAIVLILEIPVFFMKRFREAKEAMAIDKNNSAPYHSITLE